MPKRLSIEWFDQPETHNYPAALSYLTLLFSERDAKSLVERLRKAPVTEFKSKDIFRASSLPMLPLNNSHVKKNEKKILAGQKLSPILLCRDFDHRKLIIADGYHRLCAVYDFDEDVLIPCKIV